MSSSDERRRARYSALSARRRTRLSRELRALKHLLRQRWELTPLGRRALKEAGERAHGREQVAAPAHRSRPARSRPARCCWCEKVIRPSDAVIPVAIPVVDDDHLMHDAPECRGEFERFVHGERA